MTINKQRELHNQALKIADIVRDFDYTYNVYVRTCKIELPETTTIDEYIVDTPYIHVKLDEEKDLSKIEELFDNVKIKQITETISEIHMTYTLLNGEKYAPIMEQNIQCYNHHDIK